MNPVDVDDPRPRQDRRRLIITPVARIATKPRSGRQTRTRTGLASTFEVYPNLPCGGEKIFDQV